MTLYLSDLDGTLLSPNGTLPEGASEILDALNKKGIHFTVATGRTISTVSQIFSETTLSAPAVLMNGVTIYDLSEKRYIKAHILEDRTAENIISAIESFDQPAFFYTITEDMLTVFNTRLYTPWDLEFKETRSKSYKHKGFKDCANLREGFSCGFPLYFFMLGTYDELFPIKREVEKIEGQTSVLYRYTRPDDIWLLEIFSEKASKGEGVKFLKQHTGATRVVAFGDNLNDIPMLQEADHAIAVGNAYPEVKEIADEIIGKNSENAVLNYLKNLL